MVTQPSISKAISSLEKELDVSLFNRKGKKIALNDAGRLLQSRMYDVMPVLDNLANELRAIDNADGSVVFLKILAVHESVARLLIRYRRENPSVTFRLVRERNASTFDLCFSAVPHEVNITNGKLALREEIMRIALLQSATDSACAPSDFLAREHVVVASHDDPGARAELEPQVLS